MQTRGWFLHCFCTKGIGVSIRLFLQNIVINRLVPIGFSKKTFPLLNDECDFYLIRTYKKSILLIHLPSQYYCVF